DLRAVAPAPLRGASRVGEGRAQGPDAPRDLTAGPPNGDKADAPAQQERKRASGPSVLIMRRTRSVPSFKGIHPPPNVASEADIRQQPRRCGDPSGSHIGAPGRTHRSGAD